MGRFVERPRVALPGWEEPRLVEARRVGKAAPCSSESICQVVREQVENRGSGLGARDSFKGLSARTRNHECSPVSLERRSALKGGWRAHSSRRRSKGCSARLAKPFACRIIHQHVEEPSIAAGNAPQHPPGTEGGGISGSPTEAARHPSRGTDPGRSEGRVSATP